MLFSLILSSITFFFALPLLSSPADRSVFNHEMIIKFKTAKLTIRRMSLEVESLEEITTKTLPKDFVQFKRFATFFENVPFKNPIFSYFIPVLKEIIETKDTSLMIIKLTIGDMDIRNVPDWELELFGTMDDAQTEGPLIQCPRPMSSVLLKKVSRNIMIPKTFIFYQITLSALQGNTDSIAKVRHAIAASNLDQPNFNFPDVFREFLFKKRISNLIVLIAAQTDLEKQNYSGQAPIHISATSGNAMLVELLLFLGVNPSLRDSYRGGCTPLHYAAFHGKVEVASILLRNGADTAIENSFHKTPLDFALITNHQQIIGLLVGPAKADCCASIDYIV